MLVKLLCVVLESLEHANLHELLQRQLLVRPIFELDVGLFGQKQVSFGELLLVRVEFLVEGGNVATSVSLSQIAQLCLVLVLHLGLLVAKVLLLRLNDHVQLCLLTLHLLNQLLQVRNLLEVLDLLGGDLLVKKVLLFLVSDLVFQVPLTQNARLGIQIELALIH